MKHGNQNWIKALLAVLLAVVCIGGAELAASSYFAPTFYHQVTDPVKEALRIAANKTASFWESAGRKVSDGASKAAAELAAWWEVWTAPPPEESEEPETQLAGEPEYISEIPISDPAVTELRQEGELELLTGGLFPVTYFCQSSEPWASLPYGSDDIGRYGCGPTAMAIAVSSLTGETVDPGEMAAYCASHGYWAKKSGSYLSIVEGVAADYGLTASAIPERTVQAVESALLSGDLLVALMGPGHFTKGGHFIVLRGISLGGSLLVADPNSLERSLMEWDIQQVLDELSASTAHDAPLWVISQGAS